VKRASLLALCAVLALAVTPAEAKKKHKKPSLGPVVTATAVGNTASGPGSISIATAFCPIGLQAVGGGYSAPFVTNSRVAVLDSFRGPTSWTVDGIVNAFPGAVTSFVYCRRNIRTITDLAGRAPVPGTNGANATASASCPPGTQLIGGGFESTHGPDPLEFLIATTDMSVTPGAWSVTAFNNGHTTAQTLTAHAYCMSGIRAPRILSSSVSPAVAPLGSATATTAACPKAKKTKKKHKKKPARRLSAGGFSTPPPTSTSNPIPLFTDTHIDGSGWLATAVDAGGPGGTLPVTSQGFCV